jgi:hypothetical protein
MVGRIGLFALMCHWSSVSTVGNGQRHDPGWACPGQWWALLLLLLLHHLCSL